MHGPTLPAALPVLEAGMAILHRADFGSRADFAYALLLNNAMLTVSMSDDRLQHERGRPAGPRHDDGRVPPRSPTASAEVRAMGQEFIRPFAEGGENAALMRWDYYRSP